MRLSICGVLVLQPLTSYIMTNIQNHMQLYELLDALEKKQLSDLATALTGNMTNILDCEHLIQNELLTTALNESRKIEWSRRIVQAQLNAINKSKKKKCETGNASSKSDVVKVLYGKDTSLKIKVSKPDNKNTK